MEEKTHRSVSTVAFKAGFFGALGVACALPVIMILLAILGAFFWGFIGEI